MLCYQEILLFFSCQDCQGERLGPCSSPELCLSKQRTSQQERWDVRYREPSRSGPPPALLRTVRCPLLAQPNSSGLGKGRQPCLPPVKEPTSPCCQPPHSRDRESKVGRMLKMINQSWEMYWGKGEGEGHNLEFRGKLSSPTTGEKWSKNTTFPDCDSWGHTHTLTRRVQAHSLELKSNLMVVDIHCHIVRISRAFLFGKRREGREKKGWVMSAELLRQAQL